MLLHKSFVSKFSFLIFICIPQKTCCGGILSTHLAVIFMFVYTCPNFLICPVTFWSVQGNVFIFPWVKHFQITHQHWPPCALTLTFHPRLPKWSLVFHKHTLFWGIIFKFHFCKSLDIISWIWLKSCWFSILSTICCFKFPAWIPETDTSENCHYIR